MSGTIRLAGRDDADAIGRLLHAFNREFDEPTPEPSVLAARMRQLLDGGGTLVLLAGDGPDGLAVLRFRPAIWSAGLECYLAELYVTPALVSEPFKFSRPTSPGHSPLQLATVRMGPRCVESPGSR